MYFEQAVQVCRSINRIRISPDHKIVIKRKRDIYSFIRIFHSYACCTTCTTPDPSKTIFSEDKNCIFFHFGTLESDVCGTLGTSIWNNSLFYAYGFLTVFAGKTC